MSADFARIKDPARREHFVYILLGRGGRVLYIGCSMNLALRLRDHRRNLRLGHLIQRVRAIGPFNYETARKLERQMIEDEQPPHNIEWTARHRRGLSGTNQVSA